jgi:protein-disulfide isomerase
MIGRGSPPIDSHEGVRGQDRSRRRALGEGLSSPEVEQQVQKEVSEGRAADASGTPTFFVNGKRVMNRSVEGVKDMIDASMKDSGQKKG